MPKKLDLDLKDHQITALTSADAIAAFLHELGYPTGKRQSLSPKGLNLGDSERAVTEIEILSEDDEGLLRVVFARVKSVTAKVRSDLVKSLSRDAVTDHMLILTSDFQTLEFVLIDKERREHRGVRKQTVTVPRPRVFVVPRGWPENSLRLLRRLTYTTEDGLRQFDKLLAVFDAADFSSIYFTNRALFSDHFLERRLKDLSAWNDSPAEAFRSVERLVEAAPDRLRDKPAAETNRQLYDPIWSVLGFRAAGVKKDEDGVAPDYRLSDAEGRERAVALAYPWGRWLDGPDHNDTERPDENPGAAVVSLLEKGDADWAIVTNGKQWRLYSRAAHSRSTNFYEVDLPDALIRSGQADPNEAFRYWWLFFRIEAFMPVGTPGPDAEKSWLDIIVEGSREYAREVEAELKKRVFYDVVPVLADGFLHDRRTRLSKRAQPKEDELELIRQGTLTLLYRILFLLYAESRDLLPVREDPYYRLSLKQLKEEIANIAGVSLSEADEKLRAKYTKKNTAIYDRLSDPKTGLFAAMARGSVEANVPKYNGGLFRLDPSEAADPHEAEIAAFLNEHKVPDAHLAIAIDRLARVENPKFKGSNLEFVDYKALGVRQLGSIYEGLLEFKIAVATEDIAVVVSKKKTEFIALGKDRGGKSRGRKKIEREYRKGEPMLVRDKAERKATGSYYTPDHIVENTVGPVLKRKTEALRDDFRKAEKTYHRWLKNAESDARIMLGWRPPDGADPMEGPPGKPTTTDRRRFAQDKCYDEHKELVEKLFDLKVLDPAMGSGHFLVEAVDFITDELLDFLNAFPVNPVSAAIERTRDAIINSLREQGLEPDKQFRKRLTDVHLLKRHVLKRCIYGVDLNPLATELAKVSLWLDAFTLGAPLSFLDHHLRTGNSLIGSSLLDLEQELAGYLWRIPEDDLRRAVESVLIVARLSDSTAREVSESKRAFDIARKTLSSYGVLLDILVARHFALGDATAALLEMSPQLDFTTIDAFKASFRKAIESARLPETEIQKFYKARGIETKSGVRADALEAVESLAEERRFFHWDLEFPEVFYKLTGIDNNRVERKADGEAGFDAVVGNPPYIDSETVSSMDPEFRKAAPAWFDSARGNWDIYILFVELAFTQCRKHGRHAMVTPNRLLASDYAKEVQRLLLTRQLICCQDYSAVSVFDEASVPVAIVVAENSPAQRDHLVRFERATTKAGNLTEHATMDMLRQLPRGYIGAPLWIDSESAMRAIQFKRSLGGLATFSDGATTAEAYEIRALVVNDHSISNSGNLLKLVNTGTIDPFHLLWGKTEIKYLGFKGLFPAILKTKLKAIAPRRLEQGLVNKLVVAGMSSRIEAAVASAGFLCGKSAVAIIPNGDICPYALCAILNSRMMNAIYKMLFGLRGFSSNSMNIGPRQLERLPSPEERCFRAATITEDREMSVDVLLNSAASRDSVLNQGLLSLLGQLMTHAASSDDTSRMKQLQMVIDDATETAFSSSTPTDDLI